MNAKDKAKQKEYRSKLNDLDIKVQTIGFIDNPSIDRVQNGNDRK